MRVELTPLEEKIARAIGSRRFHNARNKGIVDQKIGPQSCADTDVHSAGAELAFCKWANVYPDLQFEVLPDHDAVLACGATVDVKQTRYSSGRLLATRSKQDHCSDIYVLVTGEIPEFFIRGGFPSDLLFREENLVDLGHGVGYGVEQSALWKIDSLVWRWEYEKW